MSVEIKYKDNTIADIRVGQKAKIPCQDLMMESDIEVIPRAEEVIGTVNGKVVEEVVADGVTIKKGDFVEVVSTGKSFRMFEKSEVSSFDSFLLNENAILCIYVLRTRDEEKNKQIGLFAEVLKFENDIWVRNGNVLIFSHSSSYSIPAYSVSLCGISSTKFAVAIQIDYQNSQYGADQELLKVFSIDVDENYNITSNQENGWETSASSTYYYADFGDLRLFRVDENHILLSYSKQSSSSSGVSKNAYLKMLSVFEDEFYVVSERSTSGLSSGVLANSSLFLWLIETQPSDGVYIYSIQIIELNNGIMIPGTSIQLKVLSSSNRGAYRISDKYYIFSGIMVEYIDGELSILKENVGGIAISSISDTEYVYYYGASIRLGSIENHSISDAPLPTSSTAINILPTSSASVVAFQYSDGIVTFYQIKDNTISVDSGVLKKIKTATSNRFMYGVALENGDSGETIKIAIPSIK